MTFILVMAMVITLKHPVLGYCLCLDAYFTSDCKCSFEQAAKPSVNESTPSNCSSCCGTEAADNHQATTEKNTSNPPNSSVPCDDCVKQLVVEVGDYVWHGSGQLPASSEFPIPNTPFATKDLSWTSNLTFYSPLSIRGDPPPRLHDSDIPHRLSHSVMRL